MKYLYGEISPFNKRIGHVPFFIIMFRFVKWSLLQGLVHAGRPNGSQAVRLDHFPWKSSSTMDVIFEPYNAKPFSIEIGFFDTVLEIKEKIEKYEGIPVPKQTLVFNGKILQDEHDVAHCVLLQDSRIQLIVSPESEVKIQLFLRFPMSKSLTPIEVHSNDKILQLKEKIREKEALASCWLLVLHSKGTELQDHLSLLDCELSDRSEIDVTLKRVVSSVSNKLKVMVLPKGGSKKIAVEVNASDNVGELRKELQKLQRSVLLPLPPDGYFFIYKQIVMDDDKSFRWHHVGNGDTIEIFNGSVTGGS